MNAYQVYRFAFDEVFRHFYQPPYEDDYNKIKSALKKRYRPSSDEKNLPIDETKKGVALLFHLNSVIEQIRLMVEIASQMESRGEEMSSSYAQLMKFVEKLQPAVDAYYAGELHDLFCELFPEEETGSEEEEESSFEEFEGEDNDEENGVEDKQDDATKKIFSNLGEQVLGDMMKQLTANPSLAENLFNTAMQSMTKYGGKPTAQPPNSAADSPSEKLITASETEAKSAETTEKDKNLST